MCCGGGSQTTTSTVTQNIDPQIKQQFLNLAGRAENVANLPYVPYNGQLVAPLNGQQYQGINTLNQVNPAVQGQLGIAGNFANQATADISSNFSPGSFRATPVQAQGFNQAAYDKYSSPFTQDVINQTLKDINRQGELDRDQLTSQAINAGAFGGDRAGIVQAEYDRNLADTKARAVANLREQNFAQAQNQFNTDANRSLSADTFNAQQGLATQQLGEQSRQFGANLNTGIAATNRANELAAGNLYSDIASRTGILGLQAGQAELGAGNLIQSNQQQGLDTAYQQFLEARNYPYYATNFLSGALQGVPMNAFSNPTTATTQPSQNNTLGGILGAGIGLAGLALLKDGGIAGYADGGDVEEYADGGFTNSFAAGLNQMMPLVASKILHDKRMPGVPISPAFQGIGAAPYARGGMVDCYDSGGYVDPRIPLAARAGVEPVKPLTWQDIVNRFRTIDLSSGVPTGTYQDPRIPAHLRPAPDLEGVRSGPGMTPLPGFADMSDAQAIQAAGVQPTFNAGITAAAAAPPAPDLETMRAAPGAGGDVAPDEPTFTPPLPTRKPQAPVGIAAAPPPPQQQAEAPVDTGIAAALASAPINPDLETIRAQPGGDTGIAAGEAVDEAQDTMKQAVGATSKKDVPKWALPLALMGFALAGGDPRKSFTQRLGEAGFQGLTSAIAIKQREDALNQGERRLDQGDKRLDAELNLGNKKLTLEEKKYKEEIQARLAAAQMRSEDRALDRDARMQAAHDAADLKRLIAGGNQALRASMIEARKAEAEARTEEVKTRTANAKTAEEREAERQNTLDRTASTAASTYRNSLAKALPADPITGQKDDAGLDDKVDAYIAQRFPNSTQAKTWLDANPEGSQANPIRDPKKAAEAPSGAYVLTPKGIMRKR